MRFELVVYLGRIVTTHTSPQLSFMEQFGAVTGFRLSLKATDLDSLRYARRR